jgi:hypothetical protein
VTLLSGDLTSILRPTLGLALELTQKSCQPLNEAKTGPNPAMTQGSDAQRLIFDKVGLICCKSQANRRIPSSQTVTPLSGDLT